MKGSVFFYNSLREVSLGHNPNFLNNGSHDILVALWHIANPYHDWQEKKHLGVKGKNLKSVSS